MTTPDSSTPRHIPRGSAGYDELVAGIAERNPIYNEGLAKGFMLDPTVNDYAALWEMIRNDYGGRLVDILDVTTA